MGPLEQSALTAAGTAISRSWEFSIVTGVQMLVMTVEFLFIVVMFRAWRSDLEKREKRELEVREKEITAKENLAVSLAKLADRVGGFKCSAVQKTQ